MAVPAHIRNRCKFISAQIRLGKPLEMEQQKLIAELLDAIGNGQDPALVFGSESAKGKREIDETTRSRIRQVLQLVTFDLVTSKKEGRKLLISQAIRNHVEDANKIFGYRPSDTVIDEKKIRRWWDNKEYRRFRSPVIDTLQAL